jgi:hypothetical protein
MTWCTVNTKKGTACCNRARYKVNNQPCCKTHAKVLQKPGEPIEEDCADCPICMNTVRMSKATKTICDHVFCKNCLNKWLRRNNNCPICRTVLVESPVITEFEDVEALANEMIIRLIESDRIQLSGNQFVIEWIDIHDLSLLEHWNNNISDTNQIIYMI